MTLNKNVVFATCLVSLASGSLHAAPGTLSHLPLFVASPTSPNIFFMLDDSGSMDWAMPADGASLYYGSYDITPTTNNVYEWNTWCSGANLMAYNPNITYTPWKAYIPGSSTPFPDQTDIQNVWVNPMTAGAGSLSRYFTYYGDVSGSDGGSVDLSNVPVVTWTDNDGDGQYDRGECPVSYADSRVVRASSLSTAQQTNFANWFAYYRTRLNTLKSAVSHVVTTSSARMGMATLHSNNRVGKAVSDMTVIANKDALLDDVVSMQASGATPLRQGLNAVGDYFDTRTTTNRLYLGSGPYSSPILPESEGGACQQNFVMLMTDGYWNGTSPRVGHQDNNVDDVYVYRAHRDRNSDTLADVAMQWYKTDLAPNLPDKVPVQTGDPSQNLDENNQQHLVTFGVAFGATGTVDHDPTDRNVDFSWPRPRADRATTVDDLRHAAYNGRGEFLSAKKPETLISALEKVVSNIQSRTGSSSAVTFNMSTLSDDTKLYFAGFDTNNWTGNLDAYALDSASGDIMPTPVWQGATLLDKISDDEVLNNRVIYSLGTSGSGSQDGVLMNWSQSNPQLSIVLHNDLMQNADNSVDSSPFTQTQQRIDYLRGDRRHDGSGFFRLRSSRLGDIINSAPVYVGVPNSNWPESGLFSGLLYSSYQSQLQLTPRKPMVYVGANDGLLHGFDAVSGEELMAYAPKSLASDQLNQGLHHLTESDYQHRFYVDGEVTAADVFLRTDNNGTDAWHTILVGSLHGGGQGIYALDVTDPNQFTNSQAAAQKTVMWEFTNQDDADLGYSFSTPQVVMMNNGQWAVVFGNGYNSAGTDKAKLFIVFIQQGIDGQWSAGDYIKIDTGVGTTVNKNGLSTPALVDLDNNGSIDRIYAGDLLGNMWAFDVSATTPVSWSVANGGVPLYAAGVLHPITMKPLLVMPDNSWIADAASNSPNMMVYFGTGQYITHADVSSTTQQRFYGIWDSNQTVTSDQLVEQTFEPATVSGTRLLTQHAVNYDNRGGDMGWFINLPEVGERVVVDAFSLEGLVYFNTLTPSSTLCSAGGSSWLMSVDEKTGGTPSIISFDFNGDKLLNAADSYAAGLQFKYGIASKTSVLKTDSGISYGYTSGTDNSQNAGSSVPSISKQLLPGSIKPAIGERRSWIQLFNE